MNTYLVHQDFNGKPLGIWASLTENYYPDTSHVLYKSAQALINNSVGEPWEDYAERLASRISHRDWWVIHESNATDLTAVWQEVVPSDAPLFSE